MHITFLILAEVSAQPRLSGKLPSNLPRRGLRLRQEHGPRFLWRRPRPFLLREKRRPGANDHIILRNKTPAMEMPLL